MFMLLSMLLGSEQFKIARFVVERILIFVMNNVTPESFRIFLSIWEIDFVIRNFSMYCTPSFDIVNVSTNDINLFSRFIGSLSVITGCPLYVADVYFQYKVKEDQHNQTKKGDIYFNHLHHPHYQNQLQNGGSNTCDNQIYNL